MLFPIYREFVICILLHRISLQRTGGNRNRNRKKENGIGKKKKKKTQNGQVNDRKRKNAIPTQFLNAILERLLHTSPGNVDFVSSLESG